MRIIFSTNNKGKLKELREILRDKEVLSINDIGIDINPDETGKSYEENAFIKAMACKDAMIKQNLLQKDDIIIADDSGLSVDCLDGAPGIYSARFGSIEGSHCFAPTLKTQGELALGNSPLDCFPHTLKTQGGLALGNSPLDCFPHTDKCFYLLDLMKNVKKENRKAKFVSVLCVIIDDDIKYFNGEMNGEIAFEMKGDSGFGYDPVFIPLGYDKTVAELSDDEKNKISHRARALTKFVDCVFKKC